MRHEAAPLARPVKQERAPGSSANFEAMAAEPLSRWQDWRPRFLVLLALLGILLLFALAREVSSWPHLSVSQHVVAISSATGRVELPDATLLQRSSRWVVTDSARASQLLLHQGVAQVFAHGQVILEFADGRTAMRTVVTRGLLDLPREFWLRVGLAMAMFLLSMSVWLSLPTVSNRLYVVMASSQVGNLALDAVSSIFGVGLPPRWVALDFIARCGFDLIMVAALLHVACISPQRLPREHQWVAVGWAAAAASLFAAAMSPQGWWIAQGVSSVLMAAAMTRFAKSWRLNPTPSTVIRLRCAALAALLWLGLGVALGATRNQPQWHAAIAESGSTLWYLSVAALLALVPLLSRARQIGRELGLLATAGGLALLLDVLLADVLGVYRLLSIVLALSGAMLVYGMLRESMLARLLGVGVITTERMFERLYRIAREVESHPDRTRKLLAELLVELFDPLQVRMISEPAGDSRVTDDGSTMQVPVPVVGFDGEGYECTIVLRFAQRGNRAFTPDDVRLAQRIVEQLERAVAYDRAVERGRHEERQRIAQDLHDDIGARLLTLIYKAQSPEMEDYARHTLHDLKTLTRGLAASSHRLSHAAGEWKADLTHRLTAANIDLGWSCEFDQDVLLGMVQWSALTRVLRELVSNTIAHSMATRVEVSVKLENDCLRLSVVDDGRGQVPKDWAHGLGLSGVRKRVKQMNGQVEWTQASPRGIRCDVVVIGFSGRSGSAE
jgi:signal transduction histidine kinase